MCDKQYSAATNLGLHCLLRPVCPNTSIKSTPPPPPHTHTLGNPPGSAPVGALNAKIRTNFLKYFFYNKHLFYELKHTSITKFAALVTHKTSRHSYPLALLILSYNICIVPFLLVALMVCIVIRMPNDGVCQIQVITQDADMAKNINFNG